MNNDKKQKTTAQSKTATASPHEDAVTPARRLRRGRPGRLGSAGTTRPFQSNEI